MKPWSLILLFPAFLQCTGESENPASENIIPDLWKDETKTYLPATAEWTNRAEAADINGDGLPDLIFANGGDYSEPGSPEFTRIFLNNGPDKSFSEVTEKVFGNQKFLARVARVVDINNDSTPDLIIGTTYQTQSQLLIGTGNGELKNVSSENFPDMVLSVGDIAVGDVDGDSDPDLVLADWGEGNPMTNAGGVTRLWVNDGDGKFTDVTSAQMPAIPIQFSWDVEFLDVDNDFDLDIGISCKRCNTSRIYINDGTGRFKDTPYLPTYTNNYDLEPMDVNGDGYIDLVTVNDGDIVNGRNWSRREHLFLNDSGKRFIDASTEYWPASENIGEDDNNIVFLDADSDGDPDFLLSSLTGEDRLLVNDGTGRFSLKQPVISGDPTPHTLSLIITDINQDNKPDIIMGQGEGDQNIEERIFMGHSISADTGRPVISGYNLETDSLKGVFRLQARIHDNKSPLMPEEWSEVYFEASNLNRKIPLKWYGEYLWRAEIPLDRDYKNPLICAFDKAGNRRCIEILFRK